MLLDPDSAEDKTHPIDKVPYFSRIFFTWCTPIVKAAKLTKFTQKMHTDLPKKDNIETNETTFINNFEKEKGVFKTIIRTFKKDL